MSRAIPTSVTFIVPALNEGQVAQAVLTDLISVVSKSFANYEVLLVDDGSTDDTGIIMDRCAASHERVRVIHNERNIGLGACYQRGLQEARCNYVMLLCGDGGLPARSLPAIFEKIGTADIVIPYMTNLRRIKSPLRFVLSRTYSKLLNTLFGFKLHYYNGLPVHRTDLLRSIRITSSGFGFQGEILVKLLKSGCSYVQVGVLGAEETRKSFALRPRNLVSVARTLLHLIAEIVRFRPVPKEVVERGRDQADLDLNAHPAK